MISRTDPVIFVIFKAPVMLDRGKGKLGMTHA